MKATRHQLAERYGRVVTVYPKNLATDIGDGEACDRCPGTIGRGRRLVRVTDHDKQGRPSTRVMQVCARCATALRRSGS